MGTFSSPQACSFFLQNGKKTPGKCCSSLGPLFKHCPHSEKKAHTVLMEKLEVVKIRRSKMAILILFPKNSFIFSSPFYLKVNTYKTVKISMPWLRFY